MPPFAFPIERSHVMMFARALGDENPVYRDPAAARAAGFPDLLAPPTFGIAADHFDPAFERRPQPGEPWFGSGREAVSASGSSQQAPEGGSGFHAEERIHFARSLRAGDRLRVERREGERWQKQGARGGLLHFREHLSELREAESGALVATLSWVDVRTERAVSDPSQSGRSGEPRSATKATTATLDDDPAPLRLRNRALAPGESIEALVVEDLKRTQIAMYAGASGDFHPMHHDEPYARAMGMSGVFAHGMLTMGLAGRALTDALGDGVLTDFESRFLRMVAPGANLRGCVTFLGRTHDAVEPRACFAIELRDADGATVLRGNARAALAADAKDLHPV